MIFSYGITQQGAYHIKNNTICQDAHNIVKCNGNMAIAAVADGLGSEEYSDIASKIAANTSTQYCAEHIRDDCNDNEILQIINNSFELSQRTIEQTAKNNDHEIDQYDTTLSLVVLINDQLYYGHSGDSGIIALTTEGLYCKVTEQQRDSEGRVYPLFFEDKWEFDKYDKSVASVFLATDGMYEILFPIYIKNEPISIYVALARFFMDPDILKVNEYDEETIQNKINNFIASISESQVNDDKTVVVLINTEVGFEKQPDSYYREPDWNELKRKYEEEWKRAAYPHLYNKDDEASSKYKQ